MASPRPKLLAIVELGGYPNFTGLYQRLGFDASFVSSQRKAQAYLKAELPAVIVTEYNFQSDFRDRSSNLETLMARLQRHPEVKVLVLYPPEQAQRLALLQTRFPLFGVLPLPVTPEQMEQSLGQVLTSIGKT
jgi:DNA-binding NtrC family response regulator